MPPTESFPLPLVPEFREIVTQDRPDSRILIVAKPCETALPSAGFPVTIFSLAVVRSQGCGVCY